MGKIKALIKGGFKFLFNRNYRTVWMCMLGRYDELPDDVYLKKLYRATMEMPLNLDDPQTFNEKLQWLKLYDRKPEYTDMVDKYAAKQYVADRIGEEYIIPNYGIWERFEDIDFDKLPDQFVLKCTHDCGGLVICRDKSRLDIDAAKKKIERAMKKNYYLWGREWPYKNVKPRIIAEQYMSDSEQSDELSDYKFMCFNGEVKCIFTCTERFSDTGLKVTFFDREWNRLPYARTHHAFATDIPRPSNLAKMMEAAEKLAKDIPFIRVDFYEVSGKVYFGELTFYPGSGFEGFEPHEWDVELGSWIDLPKKG